jgi:hypothetical protein
MDEVVRPTPMSPAYGVQSKTRISDVKQNLRQCTNTQDETETHMKQTVDKYVSGSHVVPKIKLKTPYTNDTLHTHRKCVF